MAKGPATAAVLAIRNCYSTSQRCHLPLVALPSALWMVRIQCDINTRSAHITQHTQNKRRRARHRHRQALPWLRCCCCAHVYTSSAFVAMDECALQRKYSSPFQGAWQEAQGSGTGGCSPFPEFALGRRGGQAAAGTVGTDHCCVLSILFCRLAGRTLGRVLVSLRSLWTLRSL